MFFFSLHLFLLLLSLFFLWPSSDHIWSCRQITRISEREISMSEYLIFPALLLCISPSLHLSVSNTSCRARSWLIRALVANAGSHSPRRGNEWGSDALRLWSWTLSYWWLEIERGGEAEMKMRRRQMKRDENLLRDVFALRSFVISGRSYETLEFMTPSPRACDMRKAPTPISLFDSAYS